MTSRVQPSIVMSTSSSGGFDSDAESAFSRWFPSHQKLFHNDEVSLSTAHAALPDVAAAPIHPVLAVVSCVSPNSAFSSGVSFWFRHGESTKSLIRHLGVDW